MIALAEISREVRLVVAVWETSVSGIESLLKLIGGWFGAQSVVRHGCGGWLVASVPSRPGGSAAQRRR